MHHTFLDGTVTVKIVKIAILLQKSSQK